MDRQTVIVHGVGLKGCVADKAGLRKDVMGKLVGHMDMYALRDPQRVCILPTI